MSVTSEERLRNRKLLEVVRSVRRRWRLKVALRGLAIVTAAGTAAFLLSAYGMEWFQFTPRSVTSFRVVAWAVSGLLAIRFLVLPLGRRVSDERVALYLEEHEPRLEARVLSAVELATLREEDREVPTSSPALARGVVESAIERCREIDFGRRIERGSLQRSGGILAGTAVFSVAFFLLGPGYVRHGMSALLSPSKSAEEASPYSIRVAPGNATVARGSDQVVKAELVGFRGEEVDLLRRRGEGATFEPLPMIEDGEGGYEVLLLDLDEATEYFVRSGGVRSEVFAIEVADLPTVRRLELEYRFPEYTGLPSRTVENGGDIAAVRGTVVRVRAVPTMGVPGGRLVMDDSTSVPLEPREDASLVGSLEVVRDGFYRVELERPGGEPVEGSPMYAIDVLADQPPSVSFSRPGRDTRASAIDEVFVEARADDDYGIGRLELTFSVNGGPEERVELLAGSPIPRVSAGYTFFLEEYELRPGDVVSYHARATDNAPGAGGQSATSDIYFLQIRPFRQDFRQSDQRGQPGGGAGAAGPETLLSARQREIVAGTFNLDRDRERYSRREFEDNRILLVTAQGQLREQVSTLLERMATRLQLSRDPELREMAGAMEEAGIAMDEARSRLEDGQVREALGPEQRALQHLLRAEEAFGEVRVGTGGGGGEGAGSSALEDLVDLYELELNKLRNQYETVQRGRQQEAADQIDQTREKLKELARRQQQELERQRRRAENLPGAQSGGGGSQRQLAAQTEEAARRLERLARETGDGELQETARQLQDAADAMRRSAANPGSSGSAEAGRALDRLDEARRRLDRARSDRLEQEMDDVLRRSRLLSRQQEEMAEDVRSLAPRGGDRTRELGRILQEKDRMEREVRGLERQLDELSADARREQGEASRRMKEAADGIRDAKVKEKLRYSKALVNGREPEFAAEFEDRIAQDLNDLTHRIEEARGAIARGQADRAQEVLDRTRDLLRGVESLGRRMEAGESSAGGDQSREPEAGEDGPPGSAGGPGGQERAGRPGAVAGGPPGRLTPDRIRQFRSELSERREEAQRLQQELDEVGGIELEGDDMTEVIRAMRALEEQRTYRDPAEVARLRRALVEELKRFEYALRREVEGEGDGRLFLSGSDEVPQGFRSLVEEYYRALAREGGR